MDAFGLDYNVEKEKPILPPLNKTDQQMYDRLKRSVEQINLYKEGKIEFQSATDFLNEL